MVEENLILVLKTSYNSSVISKLEPMDRIDEIDIETKLFEFFIRNIPYECIKIDVVDGNRSFFILQCIKT